MSDVKETSEASAAEQRVDGLEARVMELEIALAFERQTREALDEVVQEFAQRVERLERRLSELGEQLSKGEGSGIEADDGAGYGNLN